MTRDPDETDDEIDWNEPVGVSRFELVMGNDGGHKDSDEDSDYDLEMNGRAVDPFADSEDESGAVVGTSTDLELDPDQEEEFQEWLEEQTKQNFEIETRNDD